MTTQWKWYLAARVIFSLQEQAWLLYFKENIARLRFESIFVGDFCWNTFTPLRTIVFLMLMTKVWNLISEALGQ